MMTEPKIEHRNEQPYVGIRDQVTMQLAFRCRMIKGWVEKRTILVLSFAAYENNQERWIDWAGCLVRDRSGYAGRAGG